MRTTYCVKNNKLRCRVNDRPWFERQSVKINKPQKHTTVPENEIRAGFILEILVKA